MNEMKTIAVLVLAPCLLLAGDKAQYPFSVTIQDFQGANGFTWTHQVTCSNASSAVARYTFSSPDIQTQDQLFWPDSAPVDALASFLHTNDLSCLDTHYINTNMLDGSDVMIDIQTPSETQGAPPVTNSFILSNRRHPWFDELISKVNAVFPEKTRHFPPLGPKTTVPPHLLYRLVTNGTTQAQVQNLLGQPEIRSDTWHYSDDSQKFTRYDLSLWFKDNLVTSTLLEAVDKAFEIKDLQNKGLHGTR